MIDFSKYSLDSLKFVYNQAVNLNESIISSFRRCVDYSYYLLMLIIGLNSLILSSFNDENKLIIILLIVFNSLPIFTIIKNLSSKKIIETGNKTSALIHEYYEVDIDNQLKLMYQSKVEDIDSAIIENAKIKTLAYDRYKNVIIWVISNIIISSFIYYFYCIFF